ncbi:MAG: ornithine--oxo-acid transaminase [Burkholderiaceae bacterium]|nr:MAG: ornithine--oxo-acid transaminase [Burkholderiaceae bacterium]
MSTTSQASSQTRYLIERESRVCAHNYHPVPLVIDHAQGVWMWDVEGNKYLDAMSAYSAVSHGHGHPRILAAAKTQLDKVAVTSRAFHTRPLMPFMEKLSRLSGFDKVLPMNSGAEAVETAIKAARRWGYRVKGIPADRAEIMVARGNFHGRTTGVISFSTEPSYRADFGPFSPGFTWFDFGDLASMEAARTAHTCAVLLEPIQGEAGIIVPPPGYLRAVRDWCDEHDILLILDEIQSGLGRTGRMFAFEHEGIRPDGMTLGKALGGGILPVSAFLANDGLMAVFEPGSHGSTFGGNPLAAAVALEALNVMEDEQLPGRSAALGHYLQQQLQAIADRSTLVRAVRGRGLWVGVDLDPARVNARKVVERLAQHGVLSKETHDTVIRFAPPLTITREEIDWALERVVTTLNEFEPAATTHAVAALTQTEDASRPSTPPHLLMSPPDFFEVSYRINPWMEPDQWAGQAQQLAEDARAGWQQLKSTYEWFGATVTVKPPAQGLPDMVFTANCAVVLDGKVLLARYMHAQRQGEEVHGRKMFEALRREGKVTSLHTTPPDVFFEGAGDAIWDATRGVMWLGYGQRSSRKVAEVVRTVFSVPTLSLELISPHFYHLDTCFCRLSGGEIMIWPQAFSADSLQLLLEIVGDRLILAGEEDAMHLGVNSVCIGNNVVMCHCSDALRATLEARGYTVHVVDLGAFNRSGGAAYCLTLRLDQRSTLPTDTTPLTPVDQTTAVCA